MLTFTKLVFNYRGTMLLALSMVFSLCLQAQNLVPNGDFEQYNGCPTAFTGLRDSAGVGFSPTYVLFPTVKDWVRPLRYSTPDYFNTCAPYSTTSTSGNISVPQNAAGYQQPHSGNAYMGVLAYHSSTFVPTEDYREQFCAKLRSPMKSGVKYCVSFFVSPSSPPLPVVNNKPYVIYNYIAVNEFGAAFTDTLPYVISLTLKSLSLPYDVGNDTARHLDDTSRWYEIKGIYAAKGGEEWITIGSFHHFDMPAAYNQIPGYPPIDSTRGWRSYYYVDDVSVTEVVPVHSSRDTTICSSQKLELHPSFPSGPYHWNTGDTTASITITQPGTYWCQSIQDCLEYTDTIIVAGTQVSPPSVRDTAICMHIAAPVLAVAGSGIMWYTDTTTLGTGLQPVINTSVAGSITLFVSSSVAGCESSKLPIHIVIRPLPVHHAREQVVHCNGEPQRSIGSLGQAGISYLWNIGDTTATINPPGEGAYTVRIANECGSVMDTIEYKVSGCEDCIHFPSAFSPNADSKNDLFKPVIGCLVKEYLLRVYDRWGGIVFVTSNAKEGWDGNLHGKPVAVGTYMYFSTWKDAFTGKEYFAKGDLTVVR